LAEIISDIESSAIKRAEALVTTMAMSNRGHLGVTDLVGSRTALLPMAGIWMQSSKPLWPLPLETIRVARGCGFLFLEVCQLVEGFGYAVFPFSMVLQLKGRLEDSSEVKRCLWLRTHVISGTRDCSVYLLSSCFDKTARLSSYTRPASCLLLAYC
jgi:hypothetical protein